MKQLTIEYLDNIVTPCSKNIIHYLSPTKYSTINQEFDDIDFTHDCYPNDFDNFDEIDVFVTKLNDMNLLNNEQNKLILFDWICHWFVLHQIAISHK